MELVEVVVAELSLQLQLWFLIHSDACTDDEERKVLIMLSIYPNFHTQALLPAPAHMCGFWSSFVKFTIVKLLSCQSCSKILTTGSRVTSL